MSLEIKLKSNPNISELRDFFEKAFAVYNPEDEAQFDDSDNHTLDEWFAADELSKYLEEGFLLEARIERKLVGAVFVAKQHALTWPDGRKMEIFILGVDPTVRGQSIGKKLMQEVEKHAKEFGAESLMVNTHHSLISVQRFYETLGYQRIGRLKNYYANGDGVFFQKKIS